MRIAIVQSRIGSDLEANLAAMLRELEHGARQGANVAVFPECSLTGYLGFEISNLGALEPKAIHQAIFRLQAICRELSIACISGQYFKRCGRWYNNAVAIDANGRLVASYDKCQLVDQDCYEVEAGRAPVIFTLDGVKCSIGICHDIRYPEILRPYGAAGVQVHFHPFYGARKPGEDAARAQRQYDAHVVTRAVENGFFLIGANAALDEQMIRSQAITPEGECVAKATTAQPELVIAEIDPALGGDGWAAKRRNDLYEAMPKFPVTSYFDRAVWEHKDYMIDHSTSLFREDHDDR